MDVVFRLTENALTRALMGSVLPRQADCVVTWNHPKLSTAAQLVITLSREAACAVLSEAGASAILVTEGDKREVNRDELIHFAKHMAIQALSSDSAAGPSASVVSIRPYLARAEEA